MAASSARVSVTAEVVGTGSDGTEPSLLFSVQRHGLYSDDVKVLKRYLFNCGEGTQRLAGENGIKLSSLDAMYFTRFDVKSVSGVPGVIFALGSCGAATLRLHGPIGLRGFLIAIRSFVRRKFPQIQCVEIIKSSETVEQNSGSGNVEAIESETWEDGDERTDQHALIMPISLGCEASTSKHCLLCEKKAATHSNHDTLDKTGSSIGPCGEIPTNKACGNKLGLVRENDSDEHEQCRAWLIRYYTEKVPAKIPYVDVVLNRYRGRYDDLKAQLCAKYGNLDDDKIQSNASGSSSSSDSSDSGSDEDDNTAFDYAERTLDRRWLEKFYAQYQPEKLAHVDRVLGQFSGREDSLKQMLLKKYGQNASAVVAAAGTPAVPNEGAPTKKRKLLDPSEEGHAAASSDCQVPKIYPVEGNLDERSSMSPESLCSSLCYIIQFQYAPYPVVWIIDCRTPDHLASLELKFAAMRTCNAHLPSLVVHLSPANVQAQPRYKQWMASLISSTSPPKQLVFDGEALQSVAQGAFSYAFISSAKSAVRRELCSPATKGDGELKPSSATMPTTVHLARFLKQALWSAESPCQGQILRRVEGCQADVHIAQSKLQFRFMHPKNLQLGFNYERTGWHQKAEKDKGEAGGDGAENGIKTARLSSGDMSSTSISAAQADVDTSRKLIVLGTGSAAPSKLRASSGMYLELSATSAANVESMLVDCGEGTFGQLWRQFGSDVSQRIGGLRCIWISHNHADHHCGLVRVLYEYWHFHKMRQDGKETRPLVVVAPQSVLSYVTSWLPQFLRTGPDQQLIKLVTCSDFNDLRHPLRCQLLSEIGYAVTSLLSVRVFHCYDSYGLVLTLRGGKKLVYSGDTKPCNELVRAGMGAELLVHEATFDDSMEQDAVMKKHSTVGQALDISRRMRARQVVLTHFSQRYPSLPPPITDSSEGPSNAAAANVLCAYDGFVHPMPF